MPGFLRTAFEPINLLASAITSLLRFWAGWRGRAAVRQPDRPIVLYEFEGCPFCRIAREAVTSLQLDADIRPCPHGGKRYRPQVADMGGKTQFPYLIDETTGVRMYESADIVRYLHKTYGDRAAPLSLWLGPLNNMVSSLSMLPRLTGGRLARGRTKEAPETFELWAIEGDPRARLVREMLCELEIPYGLRTSPWDAGRYKIVLVDKDPANPQQVEGSFAIRAYLLERFS